MRTGRCFRVVLDAEGATILQAKTLDDVVIEADVTDRCLTVGRGKVSFKWGVNREPVVVCGYCYPSSGFVEDRLINPTMTEFKFVCR